MSLFRVGLNPYGLAYTTGLRGSLDQDAESVTVQGGNDSGVDHNLSAVAVCLLP